MPVEEKAFSFLCQESWLYGITSAPENALTSKGVLIVVGGPQYRAGSHRQFTLIARYLAARGIPVMRFDVRGMGDSEGDIRTFEAIDRDLQSAIDQFYLKVPNIKGIILWGLCDAASAASFYAHTDKRVSGLVLLNPWVRTESGMAKIYFKHYYFKRLFDPGLWKKFLSGQFDFRASLYSVVRFTKDLISSYFKSGAKNQSEAKHDNLSLTLQDRMYSDLKAFDGKLLIITSGNDLVAQEFLDLVKNSGKWQKLLENAEQQNLPDANHTFSQRVWRDQVAQWTYDWVKRIDSN